MMITILPGTCNRVFDTRWMPRADASDFAQTLVGLARQLGHTPACNHTLITFTLSDSNGVDHFVLLKNALDWNRRFEKAFGICNLISHGPTIDLNLADVSLLLAKIQLRDLGVPDDTENAAVLGETFFLFVDSSSLSE